MKRTFLNGMLLLPFLAQSGAMHAQQSMQPSTSARPNLVFIIADQWRGSAMGNMKQEPVITPCLDALAAEGINFTDAVSSYPVSSPARAMLMTGMYPMTNGVLTNCNSESAPYGIEMGENARCWSDVLKEQGYQTGYIGKWHLDAPYKPYVDTYNNRGKVAWNEWCPPARRHGFDLWTAYGTYDNHLRPMYWNTTAPRDSFYYVDEWGPAYEATQAIDYMTRRKDDGEPFALVISMNPPHTGYDLVPDRYKALYRDLDVEALCAKWPSIPAAGTPMGDAFRRDVRDYYACITGVDENVGRIVQALKKNGQFDNTIIVFTSDHGTCMGAHGELGKNIYYDEAMRIPLIISYPAKLKPRREEKLMLSFADLYPSLLSLMGFKQKIPAEVQTLDLSAQIMNGTADKGTAQPYYYVQFDRPATGYRGWRTATHTFVVHATNGKLDETLLFDRKSDPFQLTNIAPRNPQLVQSMTGELRNFLLKTDDPFAAYLNEQSASITPLPNASPVRE